MQVAAGHGHNDVEIQLEFVADTSLDGEVVGLGAMKVSSKFSDGEEGAEDDNGEGPLAAGCGGRGVGGFCFGCRSGQLYASIDEAPGESRLSLERRGSTWGTFALNQLFALMETYGMHRMS